MNPGSETRDKSLSHPNPPTLEPHMSAREVNALRHRVKTLDLARARRNAPRVSRAPKQQQRRALQLRQQAVHGCAAPSDDSVEHLCCEWCADGTWRRA